jgi:hypothetical protein
VLLAQLAPGGTPVCAVDGHGGGDLLGIRDGDHEVLEGVAFVPLVIGDGDGEDLRGRSESAS